MTARTFCIDSNTSAGPGNDPFLLTAVLDPDWNVRAKNGFLNGRVAGQTLAGGRTYKDEYQFRRAELIQTTVIFPGGEKEGLLLPEPSARWTEMIVLLNFASNTVVSF